jgi:uncharacterized protein with PQ loop repeat
MNVGHHDHHKSKKNLNSALDKIIYIFGTLGVFIFVPQLITVWTQSNIDGVSIISWLGMLCTSSFWIFYGIVKKAHPILVINLLAGTIQAFIILGILLHK